MTYLLSIINYEFSIYFHCLGQKVWCSWQEVIKHIDLHTLNTTDDSHQRVIILCSYCSTMLFDQMSNITLFYMFRVNFVYYSKFAIVLCIFMQVIAPNTLDITDWYILHRPGKIWTVHPGSLYPLLITTARMNETLIHRISLFA